MKKIVFSYKILDLLADKKQEWSGIKIKIFFVRSPTLRSTFLPSKSEVKLCTYAHFYFTSSWCDVHQFQKFSDEKNKTTAITSMCAILCNPEDGYMNYELEMKQMFHKVAPFIYCAILWNIFKTQYFFALSHFWDCIFVSRHFGHTLFVVFSFFLEWRRGLGSCSHDPQVCCLGKFRIDKNCSISD